MQVPCFRLQASHPVVLCTACSRQSNGAAPSPPLSSDPFVALPALVACDRQRCQPCPCHIAGASTQWAAYFFLVMASTIDGWAQNNHHGDGLRCYVTICKWVGSYAVLLQRKQGTSTALVLVPVPCDSGASVVLLAVQHNLSMRSSLQLSRNFVTVRRPDPGSQRAAGLLLLPPASVW